MARARARDRARDRDRDRDSMHRPAKLHETSSMQRAESVESRPFEDYRIAGPDC